MKLDEAKTVLLADCPAESDYRAAIEALPDRSRFEQLDPLARALVETRLMQLVTMEVVT